MPVLCTLLVEDPQEKSEKSIRDLMAETVQSIDVHNFPIKWPELLPALLVQVSLNSNPGQALRVHNAQPALRKVCTQYEYKRFPLLLLLYIRLINPNQHSLDVKLILKQVLNILWSSVQFYLPGVWV